MADRNSEGRISKRAYAFLSTCIEGVRGPEPHYMDSLNEFDECGGAMPSLRVLRKQLQAVREVGENLYRGGRKPAEEFAVFVAELQATYDIGNPGQRGGLLREYYLWGTRVSASGGQMWKIGKAICYGKSQLTEEVRERWPKDYEYYTVWMEKYRLDLVRETMINDAAVLYLTTAKQLLPLVTVKEMNVDALRASLAET